MKHPLLLVLLAALPLTGGAREWTLGDCLTYAEAHNIQVRKSLVAERTGEESLKQARAQLWPSLSANVSQSVNYRPFPESYTDASGLTYNVGKKSTYGGQYGINANWTLWDGGANIKEVSAQKVQNEINTLTTAQTQLNLKEQIAQLYVQIMYCQEAQRVNAQLLETAEKQLSRGQQLKTYGQIAKADLAELEAQRSAAQNNVVNSETQTANYKRQLKALLELDMTEPFDVVGTPPADERALEPVPEATTVYAYALDNRPEMRSARLAMDAANINLSIARRSFSPSLSLGASLGDSHNSNGHGSQMKTNLNMSAGVTLSVPLWQQRRNITALNKAKLQKVSSQLDYQDTQNTLSSTIEQHWLDATRGQQNFISAQARAKSQRAAYELLNQQYEGGLKNIVELLQARDNLVEAEQNMLQTKYTTLLSTALLKLYNGEDIDL